MLPPWSMATIHPAEITALERQGFERVARQFNPSGMTLDVTVENGVEWVDGEVIEVHRARASLTHLCLTIEWATGRTPRLAVLCLLSSLASREVDKRSRRRIVDVLDCFNELWPEEQSS